MKYVHDVKKLRGLNRVYQITLSHFVKLGLCELWIKMNERVNGSGKTSEVEMTTVQGVDGNIVERKQGVRGGMKKLKVQLGKKRLRKGVCWEQGRGM